MRYSVYEFPVFVTVLAIFSLASQAAAQTQDRTTGPLIPALASIGDLPIDDDIPVIDECHDAVRCYHPSAPQRTPSMIGDFFGGYRAYAQGSVALDHLVVIANDLDVPGLIPPAGSPLTITEPGPVGIFSSSVVSVQQLQQLLRTGSPIPPATLVGSIADNATMTTSLTVAQINALFGSTPGLGYDIVPVIAPPGTYNTTVDGVFLTRNSTAGATTYVGSQSGAMLQGGADMLAAGDFDAFYFYSYLVTLNVVSPSAGMGPVGRMKVADANSPLPRDRVYFRYGMFDGVPMSAGGVDMDRFTPGFEKTFWGGTFSLEMRFPFAATLDNNIVADAGGFNAHNVQFGNLGLYVKTLIHASDQTALSGGLGITAPTGEDLTLMRTDFTPLLSVNNSSVHLQPFISGLYTPNERLFTQGFVTLDIDANGNSVLVNNGSGLASVGRLNDATFLFADVGTGYWLHRSGTSFLTGVAPTVELHYNRSLQNPDTVTAGLLQVGNFGDNVESLNLTLGTTFEFGRHTNLAIGYIAPLGGGLDQQLNGGLRVMFDYYPGR